MMPFKYQQYLATLVTPCPPSDYQAEERTACRFVFDTHHEKHPHNFLPVLIIKPERKNGRRFKKDVSKCQGYALSFFDSFSNAYQRYIELKKDHPNIQESLGTHIAQGRLDETDGVMSDVDANGHFSLHEFEHTELSKKFKTIGSLK